MEIIDRRSMALGGQAVNRSISEIRNIGIHYTAVLGFITGHERYWRDTRRWDRGGYIFYIDRDGKLYQNYDLTRVTYGASGWNQSTVHVSMEARNKNDYTDAQLKALDFIIHKILKDCPNTSPERIFGHWEMTPTTACPGWNKAELNALRARIKQGQSLANLPSEPVKTPSKTLDAVAREVINGVWGNGAERMRALKEAGYDAVEIQQAVNDILKPGTKEELKPLNVIAQEVIDGKWGNGLERSAALKKAGYNAAEVQLRVNELAAPPKPQLKSLDVIAREVINGQWGSGQDRFNRLNKAGYSAQQVQQRVNQVLAGQRPQTKSIQVLAQEVIDGKHGSGDARRKSLGAQFSAVQNLVNSMLKARPAPQPQRKTVDQVAREIINGQGGWGNNPQRATRLRNAGYDPAAVQRRVNQLI